MSTARTTVARAPGRAQHNERVRIHLLGPLTVTDPRTGRSAPPEGAGARLRTLLTALALETPRPVSDEALIAVLWPGPDARPGHPVNALQALASRLRALLGREAVARDPAGYRLTLDPAEVDVHAFRAALRRGDPAGALALWHGEAPELPGFPAEAALLLALRRAAAEDLLEAQLDSGDAESAVPDLVALTAAEPLRPRPRALLVRALRESGRTAEARAAYNEGHTLRAADPGTNDTPPPQN